MPADWIGMSAKSCSDFPEPLRRLPGSAYMSSSQIRAIRATQIRVIRVTPIRAIRATQIRVIRVTRFPQSRRGVSSAIRGFSYRLQIRVIRVTQISVICGSLCGLRDPRYPSQSDPRSIRVIRVTQIRVIRVSVEIRVPSASPRHRTGSLSRSRSRGLRSPATPSCRNCSACSRTRAVTACGSSEPNLRW